jgi:hypothetical protein
MLWTQFAKMWRPCFGGGYTWDYAPPAKPADVETLALGGGYNIVMVDEIDKADVETLAFGGGYN